MMRSSYIIAAGIISFLVLACSKDNDTIKDTDGLSEKMEFVNLSGGVDGLSVLIFDKNQDNNFYYQKSIVTGWSEDGKLSTNLALGIYKFLFFKSTGHNTIMEPNGLTNSTKFEDIKFSVKPDNVNDDGSNMYVLPADETWLPKLVSHSDREYIIQNPTTIYDTLKRVVGKIEFQLKRGTSGGANKDSLVFDNGQNIMENIKDITLDISGIAKSVSLWGGAVDAKTKVTYTTADEITASGFANFNGLYVIPKGDASEATINFTISPVENNAFPILTKQIKSEVKRNQKLVITLWLTSTYKFIDVEVDVKDIEQTSDGDSGLWQ